MVAVTRLVATSITETVSDRWFVTYARVWQKAGDIATAAQGTAQRSFLILSINMMENRGSVNAIVKKCQGKVEMSPSQQSRNVPFHLGLCGVRVNLRVPVKRRRALVATNPIKE